MSSGRFWFSIRDMLPISSARLVRLRTASLRSLSEDGAPKLFFIAIRNNFGAPSSDRDLREAVRNLTSLAEEMGSISRIENQNLPLDILYQDPYGARVGLVVVTGTDGKESLEGLSNMAKSAVVDKLVILTDKRIPSPYNATVVNVDKSKLVDLLYFSSKYNDKKIGQSDNARAEMLAKTLCII